MVAILKEGRHLEGFTEGKLYKYYDLYNIGSAELFFYFNKDDNGKHRKLSERDFTMNFYGRYENQDYV